MRLFRVVDWPLRLKMAALLVVASLLPLGLSAWRNVARARKQLSSTMEALLSARADQLAGQIDAFNENYQRSAAQFAHLSTIRAYCEASADAREAFEPKARAALAIQPAEDINLWGAALLDTSGVVQVATDTRLVGVDLANRRHVRAALLGRAVTSSVYLEHEADDIPTIAYLQPIVGTVGAPVGFLALWARAGAVWSLAKTSNSLAGADSFAVLFDQDGIRIAHTYKDEIVFHPAGALDAALVDQLVARRRFGKRTRALLEDVRPFPEQFQRARAAVPSRELFRGFAPVNSKWNYGVARRLRTTSWTLFYMIPEESLLAEITAMTREQLLFGGAIMGMALIGGLLFARLLLRSIQSLSVATSSMAGGNLAVRVASHGRDELGRLSENFNVMAARIESQATALGKARDDLEERMRERTAQLSATTLSLEAEQLERQRAEAAEARFRDLLEASPDAVVIVDHSGSILMINDQTETLFGYSRGELIGRSVDLLVPTRFRDSHPAHRASYARDPKVREMGAGLQLAGLRKNGSEFPVEISLSPLRTKEGLLVTSAIRDITDRKMVERALARAKDAAEAASRELEAFSYSVAHDLRAPLRGMNGFAELLLTRYGDKLDADGKDWLEEITRNAKKMGALIDGLLSLARLTRSEPRYETVDLSALVRAASSQLAATEPQRTVDVIVQDALRAEVDPVLARALIDNLLANAWKFTGKVASARIEFGATEQAGDPVFFVRDNGAGFDMAYAKKLFMPFQRLHTADEFPGTGIGLATVQRIVRRHGGRVWAEGAVARGATFYFSFPATGSGAVR